MFDQIKQAVEQAMADLQSEIGNLFTLKAKILRLPNPPKDELMAEQTGLEEKVAALMGVLGEIKKQIPASVTDIKLTELSVYQGLISKGFAEAKNAVALRQSILNHTNKVGGAMGLPPVAAPARVQATVSAWTALTAMIAAGAAVWAWNTRKGK